MYSFLFILLAAFIDLSKAFDCVPHHIWIFKLYNCGSKFDIYSYLKERKQDMKIKNILSTL